jgi:hypothetical protein
VNAGLDSMRLGLSAAAPAMPSHNDAVNFDVSTGAVHIHRVVQVFSAPEHVRGLGAGVGISFE